MKRTNRVTKKHNSTSHYYINGQHLVKSFCSLILHSYVWKINKYLEIKIRYQLDKRFPTDVILPNKLVGGEPRVWGWHSDKNIIFLIVKSGHQ